MPIGTERQPVIVGHRDRVMIYFKHDNKPAWLLQSLANLQRGFCLGGTPQSSRWVWENAKQDSYFFAKQAWWVAAEASFRAFYKPRHAARTKVFPVLKSPPEGNTGTGKKSTDHAKLTAGA